MGKRVVITGTGAVTPVGIGVQNFWEAIKEGKCGIDKVERIDLSGYSTTIAGEVKDFNPEEYIDKKEAKRMDRFTQFAVAASKMAINDSELNLDTVQKDRMAVILGSGIGGLETFEDQHLNLVNKGPERVSPFFIPMMIANMAAGQISIMTGAKGASQTVVTACASGTNAIGDAFRHIQKGYADIVITGGAEAPITPMAIAGFCSMKAISRRNDDPKTASRPFDANRDGFVMSEGAGILILEEYEYALRRGANIIAEVVGYGVTSDAYHITAPSPSGEGGARTMDLAIKDAGITPKEVGYINAHGTSTPLNDKLETRAIKTVFGNYAAKVAISSTKSMTGHLLGAAGGIEGIIAAYALRDGFIPPTINYTNPDPECDLDYVPNQGRKAEIEYALSNSFGFGGHNAAILLKKF